MRFFKPVIIVFAVFLFSCGNQTDSNQLIIFHAGSLSVPLKEAVKVFNKEYPNIKVLTEAAGSRACARKITDLNRECDIMASADYTVIDQLLIPNHADWNIKFASNEMAIVFTEKSKYANEIDSTNWFEILLKDDVTYGRSSPDSDPCGYRSVLVSKLAEAYYKEPGFAAALLGKDQKYIRPKETDLIALLETHTLDYIFIYRSVAVQHGLKYIVLPDRVNLKNSEFTDYYKQAEVKISGKEPGKFITKTGEPMVYGITLLKNAPNKENAMKFLDFFLSTKGQEIMAENGQPSLVPAKSETFGKIPLELKKYALNLE